MKSSNKKYFLKNINSQKSKFFGGSDDLEPILYKHFEVPALDKHDDLVMSLRSNLDELKETLGMYAYLNREITKLYK